MYHYRATLLRVVDGDTVDLEIDLGFQLSTVQRCRLLGYDSPESNGPTRAMGLAAKDRLSALLAQGELYVATSKDDSFGRWLADIEVRLADGHGFDVVGRLIGDGYGHAWDGKGKRPPWDPAAPYPLGT